MAEFVGRRHHDTCGCGCQHVAGQYRPRTAHAVLHRPPTPFDPKERRMIADIDAEKDRLRHEIRQVIARLDLMPHAATQNFEPSPDDTAVGRARGGGRPAGGVSVGDDLASRRTDEDGQPQVFRQLSADHFRHRLSRAHSLAALRSVLEDARKAEKAWKCTPIPDQPLTGSSAWKLWVREDTRSDSEIARLSGVSRRYVSKVREGYRGEAEDREAVRRRRGEAVLKRRAA